MSFQEAKDRFLYISYKFIEFFSFLMTSFINEKDIR